LIRSLLIGALAAWPVAVQAERVVVRSGEHPGFSRLVLEFDDRPEWKLHVADGKARIVLPAGTWQFDTDRVFSLIPRTRITGVAGAPDGLEVHLGCDCQVMAFDVRRNAVAIDVADPVLQDQLRNLRATSGTGPDTAEPSAASPQAMSIAPSATWIQDDIAERILVPRASDAPGRAAVMTLQVPSAREASPVSAEGPPDASAPVLATLAEGIARAATQGILRLAPPSRDTMRNLPMPAATVPDAENLRLRLPGEAAWQPQEVPAGSGCKSDAAYDVAAWGPDGVGAAQAIGALRASLAADLDAFNEGRAIDLARLLVSLGFGAEARAVLEAMAPRNPETALLSAMAKVVDGEPSPNDAFETDCPGRAQLWVALSTGKVADAEAVRLAVLELPLTLRRHLAPGLISASLAAGDSSTAEAIRASIERAAGPHGARFDLAAARIDAEREADQGLRRIRGLASEASPASDDALILLLDVANEHGSAVEDAALALAATRADDLRGTAPGRRLEIGLVKALLRNDDFAEAASRVSDAIAAGILPDDEIAMLAKAFLAALADRASDSDVLVHASALRAELSVLVRDGPVRAAIASRLLDLGLPRLAQDYLPDTSYGAAALALTARERLLSGDAASALAILEGMTEPDPNTLSMKAAALGSLGRNEDAAAIRIALENGAGPPETGTAAPDPPKDTDRHDGQANSPRERVAASEEARREINVLLAAFPAP
jgi:hypothetical protein